MQTTQQLIIELTLLGASGANLGLLLERLHSLLPNQEGLNRVESLILLYNSSNRLIQVASSGLPEGGWSMQCEWSMLFGDLGRSDALTAHFTPCRCDFSGRIGHMPLQHSHCGERILVIPLRHSNELIGLVVLFVGDYTLNESELLFTNALGYAISGVIARHQIEESLRIRELELERANADAMHRLGIASEYRDNETGWHIMRMSNIAVAIARKMGLSESEIERLYIAAPMHDIGKIGISDSILLKPGRLTSEEFSDMQRHTTIGEGLLHGDDIMFRTAREIAGAHHERWDGSGYPRGLKGDEIPLFARICSVADVFDALTSTRPYKEAWPVDEAIHHIQQQSGLSFDPAVVRAFEASKPEILRIRHLYRDEIIDPHEAIALPQIESRGDSWVAWDDELTVGIEVIDEHHRYLFDLVNNIHHAVASNHGAREVARALYDLDTYARVHFLAEERMMERHHYPRLGEQLEQHGHFTDQIKRLYGDLHQNPLTAQYELLDFLRGWLVNHILHEDSRLCELVMEG